MLCSCKSRALLFWLSSHLISTAESHLLLNYQATIVVIESLLSQYTNFLAS